MIHARNVGGTGKKFANVQTGFRKGRKGDICLTWGMHRLEKMNK